MPLILVVDDEPAIRESLVYALERDGFATRQCERLADLVARSAGVDLVLLDLALPDGNGLDFLRSLRRDGGPPVIVLSSRGEETDRIVGLELGADDYVTKPFSPREVVARVRAVLRRGAAPEAGARTEPGPILAGPAGLAVSLPSRRALLGDRELPLSRTEFDLLAILVGAPDRVFPRGELLERVWGDVSVGERTVDVHLKSLRRKLREVGGDPELIETVRGVGYRLKKGSE